jgi:hypothetical protein
MRSPTHRIRAALFGAIALVTLVTTAGAAHACPVCFSAKDEAQRQAFFDTTIFLTLLPLVLIGGFIYWVARRVRRLEAEQSPREAPGATPGRAGR